MNTAADWQVLADSADAYATQKRAETDAIERQIQARLASAEVDYDVIQEVLRLVSRHGLTARSWGGARADADSYALRALDAAKSEG